MAAAQTKGHEDCEHNGMLGKKRRERENKRKVGSKAQQQASNYILLKASPQQQIFPSLLQSRDGDLATPSAIFFLLSSATVSSITAAAMTETNRIVVPQTKMKR